MRHSRSLKVGTLAIALVTAVMAFAVFVPLSPIDLLFTYLKALAAFVYLLAITFAALGTVAPILVVISVSMSVIARFRDARRTKIPLSRLDIARLMTLAVGGA